MNERSRQCIHHLSTRDLENCAGINHTYIVLCRFPDEFIDKNIQLFRATLPEITSEVGEIIFTHTQVNSQWSQSRKEKMFCQKNATEITIDKALEDWGVWVFCREVVSVHTIHGSWEYLVNYVRLSVHTTLGTLQTLAFSSPRLSGWRTGTYTTSNTGTQWLRHCSDWSRRRGKVM